MPLRTAHLLLCLLAGLFALAIIAVATAQTPQPSPAEPFAARICRGEQPGQQTVRVGGETRVSLPAGTFDTYLAPPTSDDPWFEVCHVESGGSRIRIELYTCRELDREVRQPEGDAVLDRILQSCTAPPTPVPLTFCGDLNRTTAEVQGPRDLTIDGRITVTLPAGIFELSYGGSRDQVKLCNLAVEYWLILSAVDCTQLFGRALTPKDEDTAHTIGRTCRLGNAAATVSTTGIQPPSVGDAGVKPARRAAR